MKCIYKCNGQYFIIFLLLPWIFFLPEIVFKKWCCVGLIINSNIIFRFSYSQRELFPASLFGLFFIGSIFCLSANSEQDSTRKESRLVQGLVLCQTP